MKGKILLLLTAVVALVAALAWNGNAILQKARPAVYPANGGGGGARPAMLPPSGFESGQPFPALALPAAEDARPRSLADFRGQKLILHVFASW